MIIRARSRLIIGIVALAWIAVPLFSGSISSAARADRSAPTVPTNLMVTAISETSVTLRWNASSDNSGKFSYRVKITNLSNPAYNSLATVSQTQTTYSARFLATNSPYSFAVYAVDGNGNKSSDSNIANASTLPDTTPPSTPVLEATVLGPSQVRLTWTTSTDNVANHCCSYSFNRNGNPFTQHINWAAAPQGKLSVVIRHLAPGSANNFSVNVLDWSGGNVATSNTVNAVTPPSSDVTPPSVPANVHLLRIDNCEEVWLAWSEATDQTDVQDSIEYEIYVNGVLSPLPVSAGVDFDLVYTHQGMDNIFTIKAVDRSGNTSAASSPVKLLRGSC